MTTDAIVPPNCGLILLFGPPKLIVSLKLKNQRPFRPHGLRSYAKWAAKK
jgi:hypothetical protein